MLNKIQFTHLMIMNRICELLLPPIGDIKHILAHQWSNLVYDVSIVHRNLQKVENED